MSQLLSLIKDIVEEEDWTVKVKQQEKPLRYPISKEEAFYIANKPYNLKSDFCHHYNYKRIITYLNFTNYEIKLIKNKKGIFWYIKITEGDISFAMKDEVFESTILADGKLTKKDFQKLHCLVDARTGDYYYIEPKNKDM